MKPKYWIEKELPKIARAVLRRPPRSRGAFILSPELEEHFRRLANQQERLPAEMEKLLEANASDLYET